MWKKLSILCLFIIGLFSTISTVHAIYPYDKTFNYSDTKSSEVLQGTREKIELAKHVNIYGGMDIYKGQDGKPLTGEYYEYSKAYNPRAVVHGKAEKMYLHSLKNGKLDGKDVKFFFDDPNTIEQIYQYRDGLLEGEWISYYESGKVRAKGIAKNGLLEGPEFCYYEDGVVAARFFYVHGKQEGWQVGYHHNGNLRLDAYYVNGVHEGEAHTYWEDGTVESAHGWEHGDYVYVKYYDKFGKLRFEETTISYVLKGRLRQ